VVFSCSSWLLQLENQTRAICIFGDNNERLQAELKKAKDFDTAGLSRELASSKAALKGAQEDLDDMKKDVGPIGMLARFKAKDSV
jgi:hypothetical protein